MEILVDKKLEMDKESTGLGNKKNAYFWTKVFGLKVGDKVRLKYGKVTWTVYVVFPQNKVIKLIRYKYYRSYGYGSSPFSIMKTVRMDEEMRKVE